MSYDLTKFRKVKDERGELLAFSSLDLMDVRRCFFIVCNEGHWRGKHYHKKASQMICVIDGELDVRILEKNSESKMLMKQGDVFYQTPGIQFEFMSRAKESKLIVFCDTDHDLEDYFSYETNT
jgi:mannose-6-phosphate isomerase-like protein (cupin superfamily)